MYRALFIGQGFNATDEGWLQSLGARIAGGQMPYRDFYFGSPPVSIYEQAALIKIFGDGYGILASRWVFSVEVALSSVLAYLVVLRYARPTLAFLVSLPTCFFTVILYYFTNYSYDGEVLALLSVALLVHSSPRRWPVAVLGGLAGSLSFMAKPTFLGLAGIVLIALAANVVAARRSGDQSLSPAVDRPAAIAYAGGFALGIALVLAYFATAGEAGDFVNKAFFLPRQTYPVGLGFVVWQDMPQWMLAVPNIAGYLAALLVGVLLLRVTGIPDWIRLAAAAALMLLLLYRASPSAAGGLPTARQDAVLLVAIGTLWLLNVAAIVLAVVRPPALRGDLFPPELPVIAFGLQYIGQYNAAGVRFSYYGTFLSIPVALLLLRRLARAPVWRWGDLGVAAPIYGAALLGMAIALTGIVDTHGVVYRDAPRSTLTSTFAAPLLAGVSSTPANTQQVDGVIDAVDSRTGPGDPILVFPDFPALYYLTGRRNPTRIGWFETPQLSLQQADEVVRDLQRDPPKVVVVQTYDEGDFLRAGPPLDYASIPVLRPIYTYVIDNYTLVDRVGDIQIFVPKST